MSAAPIGGHLSWGRVADRRAGLRVGQPALRRARVAPGGADVTVTADTDAALDADGLVVPGVGAFAACMAGLAAVDGPRIIDRRLAGGRPVLGICVGMQVLFDLGVEWGERTEGCGQWPGTVERLKADVLPHMGWNTVPRPRGHDAVRGHARRHPLLLRAQLRRAPVGDGGVDALRPPLVTWAHHGEDFVAAVENGALAATQFHPEKSGDAGATVLRNWLRDVVG